MLHLFNITFLVRVKKDIGAVDCLSSAVTTAQEEEPRKLIDLTIPLGIGQQTTAD
jgi:hypothetical protein